MDNSKIVINNLNLGGIANSMYQGLANSVAMTVGLDLHSEPGIIKVNQKLISDATSGVTFDNFIKKLLVGSDGIVYAFGEYGKIWKRTSGTWSYVGTPTPSSGSAGIMDAFEDKGYIYYVMNHNIGRWQVGSAFSTRNDNFATFTNKDPLFHPCFKANLINYIGDGNLVAQIESGVFSANALDLPSEERVRSLGAYDVELLIGTWINDYLAESTIYRWNTWSVSFTNSDKVPAKGINSFLKIDNGFYANCGEKGDIYAYNGSQLLRSKRIPGDWGIGKKAIVHNNAAAQFNNLPLFGFSNVANNPCLMGLYGLGSYSGDYSPVLTLDYILASGLIANIEIGAIVAFDDYFLVSWKYGATYGVDRLDASNKLDGAYFKTRVFFPDRTTQSRLFNITVPYRLLPAGCDIEIHQSINYGAFDKMTTVNDTDRKTVNATIALSEVVTAQFMVVFKTSGNNAPEAEGIIIDI